MNNVQVSPKRLLNSQTRARQGLWIAVYGPDGAGKSAVIHEVALHLGPLFTAARTYHLRVPLHRFNRRAAPVTNPHALQPRSLILSYLKLGYMLAHAWIAHVLVVLPRLSQGQLVLFDRYFLDYIVDPRRYRLSQRSEAFARALAQFTPCPDLQFVLDVPAQELQRRKSEVSRAESQRQRRTYAEWLGALPNTMVIDAARPIATVASDIAAVIRQRLEFTPLARRRSKLPASDAQALPAPRTAEARRKPGAHFLALGRSGNTRWLVPAGASLDRHSLSGWAPYRASSRLAWAAMNAALLWPATRALLPACDAPDCLAELDWRALGWTGKSPPYPVVYFGTPGERRKAVVHLMDGESKRCALIVKLPLTTAAKPSIEHEAQVLAQLQNAGFAAAPRLVAFDAAKGIASQSVIPGRRCGLRLTCEVMSLLQSLGLPDQTISLREAASCLAQQPWTSFSFSDIPLIANVLDQIDDDDELPAARIHGDFAPWNIKLHAGSAALVDWEEYRPHGLPLHDAYHFVHMTRYLFRRRPRSCWRTLPCPYSISLAPAVRWKLELAYLLQSLAQKLRANDHRHSAYLAEAIRLTMAARP